MKVAIINYGMGNLGSVYNAFKLQGADVFIADFPKQLKEADQMVLPGVGAFHKGMQNLTEGGWVEIIKNEIGNGKYLLGICLGMQLLATTGTEHCTCAGLNLIPGTVKQLSSDADKFRLPHIGWNNIDARDGASLYEGIERKSDFYFVHSYAFYPENLSFVNGTCDYFGNFTASIEKDNILGTQFHPEKSQKAGLKLINNFLKLAGG